MSDGLEPGLDPALADRTDEELYDTLEQQYESGEALNPEFVWEVIKRTHAQHRSHTTTVRHEMNQVGAERDGLRAENVRLDAVHAERRLQWIVERDRLLGQIEVLTDAAADLRREAKNADEHWDQAEAALARLRADHAHLVEVNAALRTRPDLAERAPLVAALAEERDRYRAALEMIAIPPIHVPELSEGCEGCAGVARAALDGTDYRGPVTTIMADVMAREAVVRAAQQLCEVSDMGELQNAVAVLKTAVKALAKEET